MAVEERSTWTGRTGDTGGGRPVVRPSTESRKRIDRELVSPATSPCTAHVQIGRQEGIVNNK